MKDFKLDVRPIALLAFAIIYFFDENGFVATVLPAVAVHELGHFLAMRMGGLRLRCLRLGLFGLEMDYWGSLSGVWGAAALAAGPLAGLLYFAICMFFHYEYCRLSGGVSLALSAFNLVPVLPLDGGRLAQLAIGDAFRKISRVISIVLGFGALLLWIYKGWFSLFAIALWLVWANNKRRE